MKCRRCGAWIEDKWTFCPYCGTRKTLESDSGFEEIFEVLEKSIRSLFGTNFLADFPFGKGFMVEVSQEKGEPKVSIKEFGEKQEDLNQEPPIPKGSKVVEPKILVKEGGKIVEVFLPNVKSDKDISIKKFENSIELRAFADKKMYFAIIPKLRFPYLSKQKFENGVLTLRFS